MSDAPVAASRVPTIDGQTDPYNHEISLVDTTDPDATRTRSKSPRTLVKKSTRTSVRDQLARRKYARYSFERYSKTGSIVTDDGTGDEAAAEPPSDQPAQAEDTEAVDFAERGRKSKEQQKKHKEPVSEVDILYENQRGAFFFGRPLYSHSSLLNFDPGPWQTKDFKDSPVNITNAQVPDPTWEWAWKTWYVDMSYDVDEEGWQYSFMFGNTFAWHGTHPWFHSFARRRRWLRKRVKRGHSRVESGKPGSMGAAHNLTTEYFTIHPKREKSPESRRPASYVSLRSADQAEEPPEDVKDVGSLMKALRFAAVDREKIDLVKKFISDGGEELAYLGQAIPDIMSFLLFQNSRQQLLSYLNQTVNAAREHREQHDAEDKPEGDVEKKRIDNLLAAVDAANKEISGLEYWSDRKHVLQTADSDSQATQTISTIFDKPAKMPRVQDHPVDEIKGISGKAEVDVSPTQKLVHQPQKSSKSRSREREKGKGKEPVQNSRTGGKADSPSRLKTDQLLIPD